MLEAIKCAKQAKLRGEVPVGAIVYNPKTREVVAKSSNQTYKGFDPTAHAEINVIREACEKLKRVRLSEFDLYVTLEPCAHKEQHISCMEKIVKAKIKNI